MKWRERSFESILDKILADGSPPLKANRVAEFAVSEPYKEPVRYLRSFRGKDTHGAMTLVAELGDM